MRDGMPQAELKVDDAYGTVMSGASVTGPVTGGITATADSITKAEVGNEIPYTQASGTQQVIQAGSFGLTANQAWVVFGEVFGAVPNAVCTGIDNGSNMTFSVMSGVSVGSMLVSGGEMKIDAGNSTGSFAWIAIGDSV